MAPCDSAVVPCFHRSLVFLHRHSLLWISSLLSPQAISPQPTAVLAPGLLSNHHAPAPSPCVHWWTHVPAWAPQDCGTDHLCSFHSVPSATDRLLQPPLTASNVSLLSQPILPLVRGLPQMWESLHCFISPLHPPGCRSCLSSSPPPPPFFLLSYPVMRGSL